ncbi:MAG: PKD domain-containing protein [Candidatus Levybacteria bacterium]|nr:PKD domain-containing protein [Candidatus Levybacteria bacterium]
MSVFSSYKKIFLLGFIIVILLAIPFSVYVAQKRQQTTTKATASTTLSLNPSVLTTEVNKTLDLDVMLDPGSGATSNQVSFVKLSISFDPAKFTTVTDSLAPNPDPSNTLISVLEDPSYAYGAASISLSIGADPTKVVTTKTKIAVLRLKAIAITNDGNPSSITFGTNTQVLSIAASDQTSENVLSTTTPATVTINQALAPTSTPTPISTSSATPTNTPSPTPQDLGIAPTCVSLSTDRSISGDAPYSISFTAMGNDPDSSISNVSFNFGDGQSEAVTAGGGIGTNSVNSQLSHTYNNPGTYTAFAILTDDKNNASTEVQSCTKIITVNSPIAIVSLPPPGPGETIIGIGILGTVLMLIGGLLFIAL